MASPCATATARSTTSPPSGYEGTRTIAGWPNPRMSGAGCAILAWARQLATQQQAREPSIESAVQVAATLDAIYGRGPAEKRRSPRVLMTADTVGGVWTYAVELARALDQRGIRVGAGHHGSAPLTAHQWAQLSDVRGTGHLHESSYRLEWMQQPWGDVDRAGDWLLALERRTRRARSGPPEPVFLRRFARSQLPTAAGRALVRALLVASRCMASRGPRRPGTNTGGGLARGLAGAARVRSSHRAARCWRLLRQNYRTCGQRGW